GGEGRVVAGRRSGQWRPRILPLDLHAVADGVHHQVVLDEASDERIAAVRVAEIQPGASTDNAIAPDDPAPGRCLGGDGHRLLRALRRISVTVVVDNQVVFDGDVVHLISGATVRANCKRAGQMTAIESEMRDAKEAGIANLDRVARWIRGEHRGRAVRWPSDGDPRVGTTVLTGHVEPAGVDARPQP